jgi:hypothetical protein
MEFEHHGKWRMRYTDTFTNRNPSDDVDTYSNTRGNSYSNAAAGHTYSDAAGSNSDTYSNSSAITDTGPHPNPDSKSDTRGPGP